ncbi:hypothetical protein RhiJN_26943 [Ceratobasidium sp. AG-Ba]|nr:hypothetical protein RhiJN_26943 [Ceratobasidium sp. AG-Ba]
MAQKRTLRFQPRPRRVSATPDSVGPNMDSSVTNLDPTNSAPTAPVASAVAGTSGSTAAPKPKIFEDGDPTKPLNHMQKLIVNATDNDPEKLRVLLERLFPPAEDAVQRDASSAQNAGQGTTGSSSTGASVGQNSVAASGSGTGAVPAGFISMASDKRPGSPKVTQAKRRKVAD